MVKKEVRAVNRGHRVKCKKSFNGKTTKNEESKSNTRSDSPKRSLKPWGIPEYQQKSKLNTGACMCVHRMGYQTDLEVTFQVVPIER